MDLFLACRMVQDDLYVFPNCGTVWARLSMEGAKYPDMLDIGTSLDFPQALWRRSDKSKVANLGHDLETLSDMNSWSSQILNFVDRRSGNVKSTLSSSVWSVGRT